METSEYGSFPIPVTCTELEGGPTVITVEMPSARADLRIVFGSGATSDVLSGTDHVLEHLLLTEDAHPELRAALLEGDDIGGSTHQVMTQYTAAGPAVRAEAMFAALAACVARPRFEKPFFRRELSIVLNELRESRWDISEEQWLEALMYPKCPERHRSPLGRASDLRQISLKDLRAYHERHYVRSNALVISSGGIAHRRLVETVMGSPFMSLASGERRDERHIHFVPTNGVFSKHWVSSPSVHLYLPLPVREDERRLVRFAAQLLSIDGYGAIYKRLRLDEGKIYSPQYEDADFPECWTSIGTDASKRAIPSIEQALREEVAKLVDGNFPQDAWQRVMGDWRHFFDTVVEEGNEWFADYFIARWQRGDLVDRWFKDAVLNADPARVHKLISARWRPERIARFRYMP